jgi:hypothetical protein
MRNTSHLTPKGLEHPWEGIISQCLQDCLRCLWPNVHQKIHWDNPIESLAWQYAVSSQEDSQMADANLLYKVFTTQESSCLIWIHLTKTNNQPAELASRLFRMSYELHKHYDAPMLPLVIVWASDPNWKPQPYQETALGYSTHRFEFQTIKLNDWAGRAKELLSSDNLFKKAIAIYLAGQSVAQDPEEHYQLKIALHRDLLDTSTGQDDFLSLYAFMDRVIPLPDSLDKRYHETVYKLERQKQVDYLINSEQFGIDHWVKKGFQEGISHANYEHVIGMLSAGIERSMVKKVMRLNDIELNRLLILKEEE